MVLTQLSVSELSELLQSREISATEVTEQFLQRIATHDGLHRAFLKVDPEQALESANKAQAMLDSGESKSLTGIPIGIKDNLSTQSLETTCASRVLAGYIPPYDATVVEKLATEGAVIIGKTNLDEFAMGTSCENSAFQVTRNPWDPDLVAGGSSGGSASAVAAEMVPISLGSDTGGSIRMPAALCGIVGFKPTYGRVSRYGLVAFASSLDQVGPMARNVEDAAILASAISGHDNRDNTSQRDSKIDISGLKGKSLRGLRVALPKQMWGASIQEGIGDCLEIATESLRKEGVIFESIDIPSIDLGVSTYYIIAPAEASSNLARFDGIRFGQQIVESGHEETVSATRGELFGHEVKLRIMAGTYVLSAGYYDAYYNRAQAIRWHMKMEFESVFQNFDFVMSPTSPVVAFRVGALTKDPMALKLLDVCTIPANLGGFPSISLPCGFSQDLPVGMCLTGPMMSDEKMLETSYNIEKALPWGYRRPPMP